MKPAHFSMLRAYRAADFFTLANGAAGTGSIFAVISYVEAPDRWRIYLALCLVPLALLLDIADGRIARRLNEHSLFGGELDSLADIVSFGVAPAVLAYGLGMRGGLDLAILLIFVACGISRLALEVVKVPCLPRPDEAHEFPGGRGACHGGFLAASDQRPITRGQPRLCLPGDLADPRRQNG